jgi:hypothetical protein
MVQDTTSSSHRHLHIASCYDGIEDSSSAELMKSPLIPTASTLSIDVSSLEAKEQQTRLKGKEVPAWQAFLLGSAIGGVLQVMVFATCYTIFKIWGENPTFSGPSSLVSYWILVTLCQVYAAIFIGIWYTFLYTRTERILFAVGIYFLCGCVLGSNALWIIVDYRMGISAPRVMPLWMVVVVHIVLYWILVKCFDLGHNKSEDQQEEEEQDEDDSFFV